MPCPVSSSAAASRRFTCPVVVSRPVRWVCPISRITTLDDVLTDIRRITDTCNLPLLVDVDTGFGGAFNIARTVKSLDQVRRRGAMHIEDQVHAKTLWSPPEQGNRQQGRDGRSHQGIAADAKTDSATS